MDVAAMCHVSLPRAFCLAQSSAGAGDFVKT